MPANTLARFYKNWPFWIKLAMRVRNQFMNSSKEEVLNVSVYIVFFFQDRFLEAHGDERSLDLLPTYDELSESPGVAYSMYVAACIFTKVRALTN